MAAIPNHGIWRRLAVAVASILGAVLLRWGISAMYGANIGLAPFIAAVAIATWYGSWWPGLLATSLGAVAVASAVPHPAGLLVLSNHSLPRIAMFFITGLCVNGCIELLHREIRRLLALIHAKDQFLSMLSHELRNPLAPIVAAVDAMKLDPTMAQHAGDQLAMIDRNVQLEARLIDDLLDMSKLRAGKFVLHRQVIELADVLRAAVETCQKAIRDKRLRLDVSVSDGPHHVHGDPMRLEQVFWNLLNNSVKFTPAGGLISISLTRSRRGQHCVRVTDTGIGLDQSQSRRIFKPFEQAGPTVAGKAGGLGLGLAISQQIIDLHRGHIAASSAGLGKGSTMTVTLAASDFPLTHGEPSVPRSRLQTRPLRIPMVEDHADTAEAMNRLLRHLGHEVTTAGGVSSALEAAKRGSFDLVLSDVGLPDGTGYDLVQRLREIQPVPCIAVTGHAMPEDIAQAEHAGFVMNLTKPVGIERLQEALARASGSMANSCVAPTSPSPERSSKC